MWSSWRDILGNAGDIGNLQGVGEEDTEGGGQEESDGAISQEEEEATELDMDIDWGDQLIYFFGQYLNFPFFKKPSFISCLIDEDYCNEL